MLKEIRQQIGKSIGNEIEITVEEAKRAQTRQDRIAKMLERLRQGRWERT